MRSLTVMVALAVGVGMLVIRSAIVKLAHHSA
jgi:hypothetical protein